MDDNTDQAAIGHLMADRTTAMRTGDAETICSSYAQDAVIFNLAPPLMQPPNACRDVRQMKQWFQEKGGRVWAEVREQQITVSGDLAVCSSLDSLGAPPDARQQSSLWYRSTVALARTDGRWLIFHQHTSTPFYMDGSMRAATDLEPDVPGAAQKSPIK